MWRPAVEHHAAQQVVDPLERSLAAVHAHLPAGEVHVGEHQQAAAAGARRRPRRARSRSSTMRARPAGAGSPPASACGSALHRPLGDRHGVPSKPGAVAAPERLVLAVHHRWRSTRKVRGSAFSFAYTTRVAGRGRRRCRPGASGGSSLGSWSRSDTLSRLRARSRRRAWRIANSTGWVSREHRGATLRRQSRSKRFSTGIVVAARVVEVVGHREVRRERLVGDAGRPAPRSVTGAATGGTRSPGWRAAPRSAPRIAGLKPMLARNRSTASSSQHQRHEGRDGEPAPPGAAASAISAKREPGERQPLEQRAHAHDVGRGVAGVEGINRRRVREAPGHLERGAEPAQRQRARQRHPHDRDDHEQRAAQTARTTRRLPRAGRLRRSGRRAPSPRAARARAGRRSACAGCARRLKPGQLRHEPEDRRRCRRTISAQNTREDGHRDAVARRPEQERARRPA